MNVGGFSRTLTLTKICRSFTRSWVPIRSRLRLGTQNNFVILVHLSSTVCLFVFGCWGLATVPRHCLILCEVDPQWERIDEDTAVGPRLGQDPSLSFSPPTPACTHRQWKRDFQLLQATSGLQKNRQGGCLLRQLRGESRTRTLDFCQFEFGQIDFRLIGRTRNDRCFVSALCLCWFDV